MDVHEHVTAARARLAQSNSLVRQRHSQVNDAVDAADEGGTIDLYETVRKMADALVCEMRANAFYQADAERWMNARHADVSE